jgi:hypothetical protein
MRTIDLASIKGMHVTKLSYRGNNIFTIYLNHIENETSDSDVGCNLIGCQYLDFNIPFGNKLLVEDTDIGVLGLKHREILHKAGHSIDGFHSLWLKLQGAKEKYEIYALVTDVVISEDLFLFFPISSGKY